MFEWNKIIKLDLKNTVMHRSYSKQKILLKNLLTKVETKITL